MAKMDIRLHLGAHRTATHHMRARLHQNRHILAEEGISVPPQREAGEIIRAALVEAGGNPLTDEMRSKLVKQLAPFDGARRIILSDPKLAGPLERAFGKELYYPSIGGRAGHLSSLFSGYDMRIYFCVRNPASFIISTYCELIRMGRAFSFEQYIEDANIQNFKWSSMLHRIQSSTGNLPITVWQYEDYPYMWRDVLQALTGIEFKDDLVGTTAPENAGISFRGARLLSRYMRENPPQSRPERLKILRAFDERFPQDGVEEFGNIWPEELIEGLSENYDDDWYYIERIEGVTTFRPRAFE